MTGTLEILYPPGPGRRSTAKLTLMCRPPYMRHAHSLPPLFTARKGAYREITWKVTSACPAGPAERRTSCAKRNLCTERPSIHNTSLFFVRWRTAILCSWVAIGRCPEKVLWDHMAVSKTPTGTQIALLLSSLLVGCQAARPLGGLDAGLHATTAGMPFTGARLARPSGCASLCTLISCETLGERKVSVVISSVSDVCHSGCWA